MDEGSEIAPEPESTFAAELAPGEKLGWLRSLAVPVLAVVTALAIGAVLIILTDEDAVREWAGFFREPGEALSASWVAIRDSYQALLTGALGHPTEIASAIGSGDLDQIRSTFSPFSETIVSATPLIFVGLSVALGFRAGLFNIGAEGQMNAAGMAGAAAGISVTGLPGPVQLILVVVAAFAGGVAWGAIPGFLKAKTGAHEVITTIMLNFIAVSLLLFLLSTDYYGQQAEPISKPIGASFPHLAGPSLRVHLGILLAIATAVGVAWLLNRSTIGFEFRAVGANPDAARAAGMNPARTTVVVMAIAGGLAGLAGANQLASITPSLFPAFASGLGFTGIAIALLGRATPGGVVAAAFLFGALRTGGRSMQVVTQTPIDIIVVIQALVVVFVAAPTLVRAIFRIKARRVAGPEAFAKGWGA